MDRIVKLLSIIWVVMTTSAIIPIIYDSSGWLSVIYAIICIIIGVDLLRDFTIERGEKDAKNNG